MKIIKWMMLLTKRLYKKPSFAVICLLIPVMVLFYSLSVRDNGGIVSIALAAENAGDPLAQQITADLLSDSPLIRFYTCRTPEEAESMVIYGKADGAWIFASDLQAKLCAFVRSPTAKNAFVRILEREKNVTTLLVREKLTGTVFSYLSEEIYLQHIRENHPELQDVPDQTLLTYYQSVIIDGHLFDYAYQTENPAGKNYLLSPVRGLLAVVTTLCGLAAAMYYTEDSICGTFSWVPVKKATATEFLCQVIAVGNVAFIGLLALLISGLSAPLSRELVLLPFFVLCVCVFAMVIRRIFRGLRLLGTVTPIITVAALCLCPVFLDFNSLWLLQALFPPTYYLRSIYNPAFIGGMALYIGLGILLCIILDKLPIKNRQ